MARESKRKRDERRFGRPERLADMVFHSEWRVPSYCNSLMDDPKSREQMASNIQEIKKKIPEAKMFVADNVSEYFYAQNAKEDWVFADDFPSVLPPFKEMFIEFCRPSRLFSEGKTLSTERFPERWGWHLTVESRDEVLARTGTEEERGNMLKYLRNQLDEIFPLVDQSAILAARGDEAKMKALGIREKTFLMLGAQYRLMTQGHSAADHLPEDAAWFVSGVLLIAAVGVITFVATAQMLLRSDGKMIGYPNYGVLGGNLVDAETAIGLRDSWNSLLMPVGMALSFMHCKNVSVQEVEPDRDVNRERKKAGLKPFVRFHTINIEPMKKVLRTEGQVETNGLKHALHICRGHFATYTDNFMGRPLDKPMTVWRPAHVRGSLDEGIIISDYNVKAPANP